MHQYWPFSIVIPKVPMAIDIITVAAIFCLGIALWKSFVNQKPFWQQLLIIWIIVLSTTLLQGVTYGFINPLKSTNDDGFDYWQDTLIMHDPKDILSHYVVLQPTLGYHSRVHPPLPLFLIYFLKSLINEPHFVGLFISIISVSGLFLFKSWISRSTTEITARFTTIILGICPAFQIYSFASIDAIIMTAFIATIWTFDQKPTNKTLLLTSAMLVLSMFLSFGVVWLFVLLVFIDVYKNHSIYNVIRVFCLAGLITLLLYHLTGYSYLESFKVAATFEGSRLFFQTPLTFFSYLITRAQDLVEPFLFLGPYLSLLIIQSIIRVVKSVENHQFNSIPFLSIFMGIGLLTFLLFISTGAYYTGETPRAALYLIVPLIASIAIKLQSKSIQQYRLLYIYVICQTVLMQLFGYYIW